MNTNARALWAPGGYMRRRSRGRASEPEAAAGTRRAFDMEGWECAVVFKHFPEAPAAIYVEAEAKGG